MSTMNELNDDCLTLILHELSFLDRVRLEAVCYKWFSILQTGAGYSDIKYINVADYFPTNSNNSFQQEVITFTPTMIGIIRRCGIYMKAMSLGQLWSKIPQNVIDTMTTHCTRITTLDLGCIILDADISELLNQISENLEVLSLEETSWIREEDGDKIQEYFCKMHRLKKLNIRRALFKLDRLHQLPQSLRSIEMSATRELTDESLDKFLQNRSNLWELMVCPISICNNKTMKGIGNLHALKRLQIGFIQKNSLELSLQPISQCSELNDLHMQMCNALTSRILCSILQSLSNLTTLTIINCSTINDYSSLTYAKSLQSLKIEHTHRISDDDIISIGVHGNLKSLFISHCINITSISILSVFRNCQLYDISITDCHGIGDEIFYSIVSLQHGMKSISVQGCYNVTSRGVALLALMRSLPELRELNLSYNRNIDDLAILSIYNGLQIRRYEKKLEMSNIRMSETSVMNESQDVNELSTMLNIYVFKTSLSDAVERRVTDMIKLIY